METLVVVDQHRSRYHGKNRAYGSSPSKCFREISCRTFQSGDGILPTPVKTWMPVGKWGFKFSPSSGFSKTPSPVSVKSVSEEKIHSRKSRSKLKKSSSVPIPFNLKVDSDDKFLCSGKLSFSELWAGPAYSNSPPPSDLPIPKFSVSPKITVSLELPSSKSDIQLHPISRSAPPSPKRDHANSTRNVFQSAAYANATKDLRRILNLDMTDE